MAMAPIVRFAPSPTGRIHIGNARAALLNWLFALKHGGQFILRYDDTDVARSTQEFADGIATDVAWLGIKPSRVEWQSKRFGRYDEVAADLKARGFLYACYETADELDRRRKRQQARGLPPVYDRASLKLTPDEIVSFEKEGRKPHWRFKLAQKPVEWNDLIRGPVHIDTATLSDPVLIREDGTYLYTLPSVIDDIDFAVTHVIRGEDHVVNTAAQIEISRAINGTIPEYAHYSLLNGADGKGLSKRLGSLSIQSFRDEGLEAMAVVSHAALLGTSDNIHPCADYKELVDNFDLSKLSRAPARFDEAELKVLNAKLLHMLPWDAVKDRLPFGSEPFWLAVRGNIEKLSDAKAWHDVITQDIKVLVADEEKDFIATARGSLPPEPWDAGTWKAWTEIVKSDTGRKGKALFMPLRLALTGLDHGPELAALLPLIGREKALARLT
ncbi:glutamate--tRNA ligase [Aestuariivirga litoralis]|uniref:glutamate--tRNA ligase n=1 Tax=Aestuariivirga litoralis TaxID=2650924 RepID=UPI0018C50399|nr:glutamate--tRNA ligase [Aestuariivirga litoralis]MBG1232190.1 glutamate--tRNA ligase [Aestuariivirga litoralis]